jgi:hypothetical protein
VEEEKYEPVIFDTQADCQKGGQRKQTRSLLDIKPERKQEGHCCIWSGEQCGDGSCPHPNLMIPVSPNNLVIGEGTRARMKEIEKRDITMHAANAARTS